MNAYAVEYYFSLINLTKQIILDDLEFIYVRDKLIKSTYMWVNQTKHGPPSLHAYVSIIKL
jgi:hypothetical protein